jgi:hypothetical protein
LRLNRITCGGIDGKTPILDRQRPGRSCGVWRSPRPPLHFQVAHLARARLSAVNEKTRLQSHTALAVRAHASRDQR